MPARPKGSVTMTATGTGATATDLTEDERETEDAVLSADGQAARGTKETTTGAVWHRDIAAGDTLLTFFQFLLYSSNVYSTHVVIVLSHE